MIPGFEEGIVGMKKGETKDVSVTFPESYRNSELAGQDAVFQITVQSFKLSLIHILREEGVLRGLTV